MPEAVGKQEGYGLRLAGKELAAACPPAPLAGAWWLMCGSSHSASACNKTVCLKHCRTGQSSLKDLKDGCGRFSTFIAHGSGELDQCKDNSDLKSFGTFSFLQCSLISPSSSTAGTADKMCEVNALFGLKGWCDLPKTTH